MLTKIRYAEYAFPTLLSIRTITFSKIARILLMTRRHSAYRLCTFTVMTRRRKSVNLNAAGAMMYRTMTNWQAETSTQASMYPSHTKSSGILTTCHKRVQTCLYHVYTVYVQCYGTAAYRHGIHKH